MNLIDYDKKTRKFKLVIQSELTGEELFLLRLMRDEKTPISFEYLKEKAQAKTDKELDDVMDTFKSIWELKDRFLVEEKSVRNNQSNLPCYGLTQMGKALLNVIDGRKVGN